MKLKVRGSVRGEMVLEELTTFEELLRAIEDQFDLGSVEMKVLCKGKQLSSSTMGLVKDKAVLMVIATEKKTIREVKRADERGTMRREEDEYASLVKDLLVSHLDKSAHFEGLEFELADQNGRPFELPAGVKESLLRGMMLHEKGRTFLKLEEERRNRRFCEEEGEEGGESSSNDGGLRTALSFLLQSQQAFAASDPRLLKIIDNYGYLLLDLAWTLLLLNVHTRYPSAFQAFVEAATLSLAEAHGAFGQRLFQMKGFDCAEKVIYCRLHLLQGVSAMLGLSEEREGESEEERNERREQLQRQAREKLETALNEHHELSVNPVIANHVQQLLLEEHNQFVPQHLVIRAVRASSSSSPDEAVAFILRRMEQQREVRERERREEEQKRAERRYGLCRDSRPVSVEHVRSLMVMMFGYEPAEYTPSASGLGVQDENERRVVQALHHANNDLEEALMILTSEDFFAASMDEPTASFVPEVVDDEGQAVQEAVQEEGGSMEEEDEEGEVVEGKEEEEEEGRKDRSLLLWQVVQDWDEDGEAMFDLSLKEEFVQAHLYLSILEGKIPYTLVPGEEGEEKA